MRRFSIWIVAALVFCGCSLQKILPTHEVYVWQRVWTPAVTEAIEKSRSRFASYVVLVGEIGWNQNGPTFAKAQVDFAALHQEKIKIGLALRIGPYRGPFLADDATGKFLQKTISAVLNEAKQAGISPTELQIDFDSAQSKLAGYKTWLEMMQRTAGTLPVTFTALPSWLREPDFRDLARQAGGFILQVHSVQMPVAEGQTPQIFNAEIAEVARSGK